MIVLSITLFSIAFLFILLFFSYLSNPVEFTIAVLPIAILIIAIYQREKKREAERELERMRVYQQYMARKARYDKVLEISTENIQINRNPRSTYAEFPRLGIRYTRKPKV